MKRRLIPSVAAAVLALCALPGCNKPTEENCRKALANMQHLMGTENLRDAASLEGEVRRCKGGSKKKAVDCAIKAQTLDELRHCDFYKVPENYLPTPMQGGSAADTPATGSAASGSAASGSATMAGSADMTAGSAAGSAGTMAGSAAGSGSAGAGSAGASGSAAASGSGASGSAASGSAASGSAASGSAARGAAGTGSAARGSAASGSAAPAGKTGSAATK